MTSPEQRPITGREIAADTATPFAALAQFYRVFNAHDTAEMEKNCETIDLAIRTSRIFQKSGEEWKLVHHHGSIEDPVLLDRYQRSVREE